MEFEGGAKGIKSIFTNVLFKKIIDSLVGKGSYTILMMVFTVVCTRLYGVEVFGEYTYAFTIVTMLMLLSKAGMDYGLIYSIPKDGYRYLSFSIITNIILSLIIIVLGYIFIDNTVVIWTLPLILLYSLEQLLFGVYRADGEIKKFYAINGFFSFILRLFLVIILYFYFNNSVSSILISVYASFIFSIGIYLFQIRKKLQKIVFSYRFLSYSFPLLLASFLGVFIDRIDIIMIGNLLDNRSVGIYQVTSQISMILLMILYIFNTAFAPKISQMYHNGETKRLSIIYIKSTRILFVIALAFLIVIIFFNQYILLIFGEDAIEGSGALILRTMGQFINVSVGVVWSMLAMTGNNKAQMFINIFVSFLNVLLNFLLIPVWGIEGAAFASLISVGMANIWGYVLVSKRFHIKVFKIF